MAPGHIPFRPSQRRGRFDQVTLGLPQHLISLIKEKTNIQIDLADKLRREKS